jgi:hypothetical protein
MIADLKNFIGMEGMASLTLWKEDYKVSSL